jgi:hypothetical protein
MQDSNHQFLIARTNDLNPSQNYVLNVKYKLIPGSKTKSADISHGRHNNGGTDKTNNFR